MQTTLAYSHGGESSRLGAYRLGPLLSETYYGARFVAQHEASGRDCSLSVIELQDDAAAQRLARAAAWAARLDHPCVLQMRETLAVGATLLSASELNGGATLRQLLDTLVSDGEAIPTDVIVRIALDVLDGLSALQRLAPANDGSTSPRLHGAVHPDTIHVGADGRARLLDAPLAAAVAVEPRWSESTARIAYATPEHCEARCQLDARSDVFSLGAVLWELVACRPLFAAGDPHTLRNELLHAPIPRVFRDRFVRGEPISAALADLTARALQREPQRRFEGFDEMSEALRQSRDVAERQDVSALVERVLQSLEKARQDPSSMVTVPPPQDTDVFDSPTRPLRALTPTDPAPAFDRVTQPEPVPAAAVGASNKAASLPPAKGPSSRITARAKPSLPPPPPAEALSVRPSAPNTKPASLPPPPPAAAVSGSLASVGARPGSRSSPIPPAGALSARPPAPRPPSPLPPAPPAGALSARPPTPSARPASLPPPAPAAALDTTAGSSVAKPAAGLTPFAAPASTLARSDDVDNTAPPVSDISDDIVVPRRSRLPMAVLVGGGLALTLLLLTLMSGGSPDEHTQPTSTKPASKPAAVTATTEPKPGVMPKTEPTAPAATRDPVAPALPDPAEAPAAASGAPQPESQRGAPVRRPVRRKRQADTVYIPDDI